MKNFIVLSMLTMVLMGCPTITTVDKAAAIDLYEERLQWRVDLKAQIDGWTAEKSELEAMPAGSSGPNPRINELAQLIANALALLNEDDRLVSGVVRDSAQVAFRELLGQDVVLTFKAPTPAPEAGTVRPGAVSP